MQTTDDSRPWPLVWLAVLRCALGLRSHDHHVFFVEDGSQCWRSYVLWGRWMTLRRSTCRDADRPHERAIEYAGYRNAARLEGAVRNVRGVLLAALAMIVLALAFAGWQRAFLGDLPGRNGEPLPRDWRNVEAAECLVYHNASTPAEDPEHKHPWHLAFYLLHCYERGASDTALRFTSENVRWPSGRRTVSGELVRCEIDDVEYSNANAGDFDVRGVRFDSSEGLSR